MFKEKLEKSDRIRGPPIRLTIDPSKNVRPMNHVRPYDVPYILGPVWTRSFLRISVQESWARVIKPIGKHWATSGGHTWQGLNLTKVYED